MKDYIVGRIDVGVSYGKDKLSDQTVPIEAYSTLTGLMLGHKWKP